MWFLLIIFFDCAVNRFCHHFFNVNFPSHFTFFLSIQSLLQERCVFQVFSFCCVCSKVIVEFHLFHTCSLLITNQLSVFLFSCFLVFRCTFVRRDVYEQIIHSFVSLETSLVCEFVWLLIDVELVCAFWLVEFGTIKGILSGDGPSKELSQKLAFCAARRHSLNIPRYWWRWRNAVV